MTHSVCICSAHQNVALLVDAMDWDLTYKDLNKKIVCNTDSSKCIVHRGESCPVTATLKLFLDQELSEHEDDEKCNHFQWETRAWTILTTFTATYGEYKETLIDVIHNLTRHSYIAKLKITSFWLKTKFKATIGVKNTASYIPWLYTTWDQMVAFNMIHCILVLMTATQAQAMMMMMMMMNWFCGMVHRRKAFSLIFSRDHCQRSSPSPILTETLQGGFEARENLSSGLVEWSCAVVITTTPRRHIVCIKFKQCLCIILKLITNI